RRHRAPRGSGRRAGHEALGGPAAAARPSHGLSERAHDGGGQLRRARDLFRHQGALESPDAHGPDGGRGRHGHPRRHRTRGAARPLAVRRPRGPAPRLVVRRVRSLVGFQAEHDRLMRPFVELDSVGFSYGEVRVLDGIDLTVEPGDFLGIIGPNGSGKTTLLRIMLGLLEPTQGTVRLFGHPPAAFRQWGRLGYVPQKAMLDPALPATVREVVATGLGPSLGSFGRIAALHRKRIAEVLGQVGMQAHDTARIGALSPGQQQRVLIARALVCNPEILILDEPTGGVDPEAQTSLYALLQHLNREREVTLVLVSHDIGVVAKEVTKLACLNRRLIFHGRPGDFLSDAALTALYGPSVLVVSHRH